MDLKKSLAVWKNPVLDKTVMKKDIHPKLREVIFRDVSCGFQIKTLSTVQTKDSVQWKGKTYPLVTFDVSSASHPFYTGKQRLVDTEGRAEKFLKKYKGFQKTDPKKS